MFILYKEDSEPSKLGELSFTNNEKYIFISSSKKTSN
nr:MAG TPA: hypothetical protein [Caudoviricetes sp.]